MYLRRIAGVCSVESFLVLEFRVFCASAPFGHESIWAKGGMRSKLVADYDDMMYEC